MVVLYCIRHTTKFSSLIVWYRLMTAVCNFILVTSESFRSVKCETMRVNRTRDVVYQYRSCDKYEEFIFILELVLCM